MYQLMRSNKNRYLSAETRISGINYQKFEKVKQGILTLRDCQQSLGNGQLSVVRPSVASITSEHIA